jgi:glycogen debranching enzyme
MRGSAFAVFDCLGDVEPNGPNQQGFFYKDARHLSIAVLRLAGNRLTLLSSAVRDDNVLLAVDLTNADFYEPTGAELRGGSLHVHRTKFSWKDACYESIEIHNYGPGQHLQEHQVEDIFRCSFFEERIVANHIAHLATGGPCFPCLAAREFPVK